MRPRIKLAPARLATASSRRLTPPRKTAASIYATPAYRAWRGAVIRRAGGRCEWVDQGGRCVKAEPYDRMFADHRIELRDGGAEFDPANGQCLCGSHHTAKTMAERARRAAS